MPQAIARLGTRRRQEGTDWTFTQCPNEAKSQWPAGRHRGLRLMDDTWKDKLEFKDTEPVLDLSQMQMLLFCYCSSSGHLLDAYDSLLTGLPTSFWSFYPNSPIYLSPLQSFCDAKLILPLRCNVSMVSHGWQDKLLCAGFLFCVHLVSKPSLLLLGCNDTVIFRSSLVIFSYQRLCLCNALHTTSFFPWWILACSVRLDIS